MKYSLMPLIAVGLLTLFGSPSIAQHRLVDLKIELLKPLQTFEGRPAVPSDSGKFVVPGAGRARFTYSGDPMVEENQLFGIQISFPGSASAFFPGKRVDSNEKDRKNTVGQPFVWIYVQEFTAEQAGMEVACVLKPRSTYQSATGQSYPAQSALFRVEWLGDGPANDDAGTIAGVWQHGPAGETWTFTPNPDGTFAAEEKGFGNARGTATVAGNKIHIEYTTSDGTSGEYDIVLDAAGRTGQGTWTSDLPDSGTRTFSKKPTDSPVQPPPSIDANLFTVLVGEHRLHPGETKAISVEVRNPSNVSNINILLEFDPNVVQVQSKPVVGSISGQRLFEVNFSEPGRVRLGFAGSTGIAQDGVLATIPFSAIGIAGNRTPVSVRVTQANRADGPALEAQQISGAIEIVAAEVRPPEVIPPTSPVVPPPRTFTTEDALRALRMSVKLLAEDSTLDVDQNGQVTSNDARIILKRVTKSKP